MTLAVTFTAIRCLDQTSCQTKDNQSSITTWYCWYLKFTHGYSNVVLESFWHFVNGIRAGISICPNVSIGHVSRPHSFTFHQLYHQRRRSEAFRFAVRLRELTKWRRVRDVVVKQVLDESLASSARSSQFVVQFRNELFHVLHHSGAYSKQAQEENQASTHARDEVKSHFFWKAWKGMRLKTLD